MLSADGSAHHIAGSRETGPDTRLALAGGTALPQPSRRSDWRMALGAARRRSCGGRGRILPLPALWVWPCAPRKGSCWVKSPKSSRPAATTYTSSAAARTGVVASGHVAGGASCRRGGEEHDGEIAGRTALTLFDRRFGPMLKSQAQLEVWRCLVTPMVYDQAPKGRGGCQARRAVYQAQPGHCLGSARGRRR